MKIVTSVARISIRIDLRHYAEWIKHLSPADQKASRTGKKFKARVADTKSTNLATYLAEHVAEHSGMDFTVEDLVTTVVNKPVLIALDGLDEVANLDDRNSVGAAIAAMGRRLQANAYDLVLLVSTRPGATDSALWSDSTFPLLTLRPLSIGLKVQYLNKWCAQANVAPNRTAELREKLIANQTVAHVRELGSNPMQLAILLHLLYRRGFLPQQRTELYQEYVKTFLDREEKDKEPLVRSHRLIIVQIHAYLAWYLQSQTELGNTPDGSLSRHDLDKLLKRHLAGSAVKLKLLESLLTAMTSRELCLVERRTGYFEFEVQSLREYFAALYIYDESPAKGAKNSRDDCLSALLERPYWSNVMRFFVGMLSKGEVKALVDNLAARSLAKEARRDPYLRWVATQLLDDRVYENQNDQQLTRVVDFALEGPGVVLGEDGLLDSAGTPLHLSEDAGAAQAAEHARRRLHYETDPSMRAALVACMARHGVAAENREWAWESAPKVLDLTWIGIIAELRGFEVMTGNQLERLVALAATVQNALDSEPLTGLLARGGYGGSDPRLLDLCAREIADGAGDLLDTRHFAGLSPPLRPWFTLDVSTNCGQWAVLPKKPTLQVVVVGGSGVVVTWRVPRCANACKSSPVTSHWWLPTATARARGVV